MFHKVKRCAQQGRTDKSTKSSPTTSSACPPAGHHPQSQAGQGADGEGTRQTRGGAFPRVDQQGRARGLPAREVTERLAGFDRGSRGRFHRHVRTIDQELGLSSARGCSSCRVSSNKPFATDQGRRSRARVAPVTMAKGAGARSTSSASRTQPLLQWIKYKKKMGKRRSRRWTSASCATPGGEPSRRRKCTLPRRHHQGTGSLRCRLHV